MLTFKTHTVDVPATKDGPFSTTFDVDITRPNPSPNARAVVALQSFDVRYTDAEHRLLRLMVRAEVVGFGPFTTRVPVKLRLALRDDSGEWDDKFEGKIRVGIIIVDDDQTTVFSGSGQFDPRRGRGPATTDTLVTLNQPNHTGIAFLSGFDISYETSDHNVLEIGCGVESQTIEAAGTRFDSVESRLGLRDDSGFWDDSYQGAVYFNSLWFPTGRFGTDTGRISVTGVNEGPVSAESTHFVQQDVAKERVFVGMTGFKCAYTQGDHFLHRIVSGVSLDTVTNDPQKTSIEVKYKGGIRDRSNEWDDRYSCEGSYALLTVPAPGLSLFPRRQLRVKKLNTAIRHTLSIPQGSGS